MTTEPVPDCLHLKPASADLGHAYVLDLSIIRLCFLFRIRNWMLRYHAG